MPKFLSRMEAYRLLQRELPPNAYPDGAPSAYYSTADMDAIAGVIKTSQDNLERIYTNYFPQDADEKIGDWEITAFGFLGSSSLTLEERQDRVVAKIRSRKGLTISDMVDTVKSVIGTDKTVEIVEWGCADGSWILGVSLLGVSTILSGSNRLLATGSLICEQDPSDFGLTDAQWEAIQQDAYTYEVRIYGYTLSAEEEQQISDALDIDEPARSQHVIFSGL